MNVQRDINFAGSILSLALDFAGIIPPVAEAKAVLQTVEDGIKVEQSAYDVLTSPQGAPVLAAAQRFLADMGVKTNLVAETATLQVGVAPADWNSPVRRAEDDNPYGPNPMHTDGD